jgi:hypothetical protein
MNTPAIAGEPSSSNTPGVRAQKNPDKMRVSAPNGDIQEVHATIIALNGVEPL